MRLWWRTLTPGQRLLVIGPSPLFLVVVLTPVAGHAFVHSYTAFHFLIAVIAVVFVVSASVSALAVIRIGQERRAGLERSGRRGSDDLNDVPPGIHGAGGS